MNDQKRNALREAAISNMTARVERRLAHEVPGADPKNVSGRAEETPAPAPVERPAWAPPVRPVVLPSEMRARTAAAQSAPTAPSRPAGAQPDRWASMPLSKAWLRTGRAAKRLGVSRATVLRMCREGAFPNARYMRRAWRIPVPDVDAVIAATAPKKSDA
jgi:excisionase family DNA binding protein